MATTIIIDVEFVSYSFYSLTSQACSLLRTCSPSIKVHSGVFALSQCVISIIGAGSCQRSISDEMWQRIDLKSCGIHNETLSLCYCHRAYLPCRRGRILQAERIASFFISPRFIAYRNSVPLPCTVYYTADLYPGARVDWSIPSLQRR